VTISQERTNIIDLLHQQRRMSLTTSTLDLDSLRHTLQTGRRHRPHHFPCPRLEPH
jgi:hypothetical protein